MRALLVAFALLTACWDRPAPPPPRRVAARRAPPAKATPPVPTRGLVFVDRAHELGIDARHHAGRSPRRRMPEVLGAGVVVFDANGDDKDDVLALNGRDWPDLASPESQRGRSRLFLARSGGQFQDGTDALGLSLDAQTAGGVAFDADGDGDRDVAIGTVDGLRLFVRGPERFADETVSRGAGVAGWTTLPVPFDADQDGDLDLLVGRYAEWSPSIDDGLACTTAGARRDYCVPDLFRPSTPVLLLNDGRGHFRDATEGSGIPSAASRVLAAFVMDIDEDGRTDVILANDMTRTQVLRSRGEGRFEDIATQLGLVGTENGTPFNGMSLDVSATSAMRGETCIAIGNYSGQPVTVHCRSALDRPFLERSQRIGVRRPTLRWVSFGLRFFDADLDGDDDLAVANGHVNDESEVRGVPFRQPLQMLEAATATYADATATAWGGPLEIVGRAIALLDFDGDGDDDVIVTENDGPLRLFENRSTPHGHHVAIRLQGAAPNTDAIGASYDVESNGRSWRRWVQCNGSYLAQSSLTQRVGVGSTTSPVDVRVRWPSGRVQRFSGLAVDRAHVLREDESIAIAPRSTEPPRVESTTARIAAALRAGNSVEAERLLRQSLVENEDDPEIYRELAVLAEGRNARDEALALIRQAVERSGDGRAASSIVVAPLGERVPAEVKRAALERAVELYPEWGRLWSALGAYRHVAGDAPGATAALRRALDAPISDPEAITSLATQRFEAGDMDAVVATVEPRSIRPIAALRTLANAYVRLDRSADAARILGEIVRRAPSDGASQLVLGRLLIELRRYPEALPPLVRATEISPNDAEAWWYRAIGHIKLNDGPNAITACERVLAIDPSHAAATAALERLRRGP